MHPLIRITLWLISLFAMWIGVSPPRPPPKVEDVKLEKKQLFDFVRNMFIVHVKILFVCYLLCEATLLVTLHYRTPRSTQIRSFLCSNNPSLSSTNMSQPNTIFLIGAFLIVFGASIRYWCYQTLGELFNFVVHISNKHVLVTSGPYAIVRHPSYTAVIMILTGIACMCHTPAGYLNQCVLTHTPTVVVIRYWQICAVFATISLLRRGSVEDRLLQDTFGEKWEGYRQDVPFKFLPYVW